MIKFRRGSREEPPKIFMMFQTTRTVAYTPEVEEFGYFTDPDDDPRFRSDDPVNMDLLISEAETARAAGYRPDFLEKPQIGLGRSQIHILHEETIRERLGL